MTEPSDIPRLIDRTALAQARARALQSGGEPDFLFRRVAEEVADRLAATLRPFPRALDLASPGEMLADVLRARPGAESVVRATAVPGEGGDVICDPEALPFAAESFDLVASGLALHFADDLPGRSPRRVARSRRTGC